MVHLAKIGFLSRGFVGRKTYTCSPKHLKNTLRVVAAFCWQRCKVSVACLLVQTGLEQLEGCIFCHGSVTSLKGLCHGG